MLGFRIACRGKLFMRGMRGEMRMRGQIGQFDLFVFDEAILFGVCKYVRRKGIVESRHIKFDTWILKIYVWILIPLRCTYLHTPKKNRVIKDKKVKTNLSSTILISPLIRLIKSLPGKLFEIPALIH